MAITSDSFLSSLSSVWKDLNAVQSQLPGDERKPFENYYKARSTCENLIEQGKTLWQDASDSERNDLQRAFVGLEIFLGINYIETEEPGMGCQIVDRALKRLESLPPFRTCDGGEMLANGSKLSVCPLDELTGVNQLGVVWANRGDPVTARSYLIRAGSIFTALVTSARTGAGQMDDAISDFFQQQHDLFGRDPRAMAEAFQTAFTMTCFFAAQVFGSLQKRDLAARFLLLTLKRQVRFGTAFEPADWAENAMRLASYYIGVKKFELAAKCLTAAEFVVTFDSGVIQAPEQFEDIKANVDLSWGRLYLEILMCARDEVLAVSSPDKRARSMDCVSFSTSSESEETPAEDTSAEIDQAWLHLLSVDSSDIMDDVWSALDRLNPSVDRQDLSSAPTLPTFPLPSQLRCFSTASVIFKLANKRFEKSLLFHKLDGSVTEHINILFDICTMYKILIFFDEDHGRCVKMHRRRAKLLEPLVGQLNPASFDFLVKKIAFDLAENYSSIFDLLVGPDVQELAFLRGLPLAEVSEDAVLAMTAAAMKSIKYYKAFLAAFPVKSTVKVTEPASRPLPTVPAEHRDWFLVGQFQLAHMYTKLVFGGIEMRISSLYHALEEFQFIIQYCNSEIASTSSSGFSFFNELRVCKEMCSLLPLKIESLIREKNEKEKMVGKGT